MESWDILCVPDRITAFGWRNMGPADKVSVKGMDDFSEKSRDGMDSLAISGVTLRSRSGDIWESRISANLSWLRRSTS